MIGGGGGGRGGRESRGGNEAAAEVEAADAEVVGTEAAAETGAEA